LLLTRGARGDAATLPARIARVGFNEFHVNEPVVYADYVETMTPAEFVEGRPLEIRARVANTALADEVDLWVRAAGARSFGKPIAMHRAQGNDYACTLEPGALAPGLYEYAVSTRTGTVVTTFPGGVPQQPTDWPFRTDALWSLRITPTGTPLRLLDPKRDYARLSFLRPGEQFRMPFFQIAPGESADESALSLGVPDLGKDTPARYAAALYIGDAIAARKADLPAAAGVDVRLRAVGGTAKTLQVTLIEADGSAWTASVGAGASWSTVTVPLDQFTVSRSIHIPTPYPGLWNYWRETPPQRGAPGGRIHLSDVERLQLTVTPNVGATARDDATGAAVESIRVNFGGGH
jgi:hypothetical protein